MYLRLFTRLNLKQKTKHVFFTKCSLFALVKLHNKVQISRVCIASWSVHFLFPHFPCYSASPGPIEVIEVMPPALRINIQLIFYLELSLYTSYQGLGQGEGRQLDCSDFRNRNTVQSLQQHVQFFFLTPKTFIFCLFLIICS